MFQQLLAELFKSLPPESVEVKVSPFVAPISIGGVTKELSIAFVAGGVQVQLH